MEDSNASANPSIHDLSRPDRRTVLRGAAASVFLAPLAGVATLSGCATGGIGGSGGGPLLGFQSVPVDWQIRSARKRAFLDLVARITGAGR